LVCAGFVAAAWYFWLRDSAHKTLPKWQQFGLLIGLVAGAVNWFLRCVITDRAYFSPLNACQLE
jgi:membrane-associated PAP2 superfamily phosphatase